MNFRSSSNNVKPIEVNVDSIMIFNINKLDSKVHIWRYLVLTMSTNIIIIINMFFVLVEQSPNQLFLTVELHFTANLLDAYLLVLWDLSDKDF